MFGPIAQRTMNDLLLTEIKARYAKVKYVYNLEQELRPQLIS